MIWPYPRSDHPEIFDGVASEGEGIRLVKKTAAHCLQIRKPWLIVDAGVAERLEVPGLQDG